MGCTKTFESIYGTTVHTSTDTNTHTRTHTNTHEHTRTHTNTHTHTNKHTNHKTHTNAHTGSLNTPRSVVSSKPRRIEISISAMALAHRCSFVSAPIVNTSGALPSQEIDYLIIKIRPDDASMTRGHRFYGFLIF